MWTSTRALRDDGVLDLDPLTVSLLRLQGRIIKDGTPTVPAQYGFPEGGRRSTLHARRNRTGGFTSGTVAFLEPAWPETDTQVFPLVGDWAGGECPQKLLEFLFEFG